MELRGQQVLYGIIEVIATHNLLKYVQGNTHDERMRMAAGAAMAGLGFVFGPDLEQRMRRLPHQAAAKDMRRELAYAAGGAALGAVSTYLFRQHQQTIHRPPTIQAPTPASASRASSQATSPVTGTALPGSLGWRLDNALRDADPASSTFNPGKPGGLMTIASAGWLGYSLFFDGKTKDEQHRHLWGLGAGALGYLYGPNAIRWVRGLTVPKNEGERAIGLLNDGSLLFGAAIGGIVGYGLSHAGAPHA